MMMMSLPKTSITLECHKNFLSKNCTMNERADHPQLIGDGGGLLTSGWNIFISYGGSKPFGIGSNGPSGSGGNIL
jgi:hypothetical protein